MQEKLNKKYQTSCSIKKQKNNQIKVEVKHNLLSCTHKRKIIDVGVAKKIAEKLLYNSKNKNDGNKVRILALTHRAGITKDAMIIIAAAMIESKYLQQVNMFSSNLDEDSLKVLLVAVYKNSNIKNVEISDNPGFRREDGNLTDIAIMILSKVRPFVIKNLYQENSKMFNSILKNKDKKKVLLKNLILSAKSKKRFSMI